jgi:hypothetical protein
MPLYAPFDGVAHQLLHLRVPRQEHPMTEATMSRDEIVSLAKYAGLDLPPEYFDELVDAFGHVQRMVARLPADRPRGDEPAHVFTPVKFLPKEA